jgi:hypothetical protein
VEADEDEVEIEDVVVVEEVRFIHILFYCHIPGTWELTRPLVSKF